MLRSLMAWVLGHEEHEVEEREGKLFCVTCDREVPREGEKASRINVTVDLDDQDVAIDIGFKKEW